MNDQKTIPDAQTEPNEPDEPRDLYLGDPGVITAEAVELLDSEPGTGSPGAYCSVKCQCGQPFRINLLDPDLKLCPQCGRSYSHLLAVGLDDDPDLGYSVVKAVFDANDDEPGDDDDEPEAERNPIEHATDTAK